MPHQAVTLYSTLTVHLGLSCTLKASFFAIGSLLQIFLSRGQVQSEN